MVGSRAVLCHKFVKSQDITRGWGLKTTTLAWPTLRTAPNALTSCANMSVAVNLLSLRQFGLCYPNTTHSIEINFLAKLYLRRHFLRIHLRCLDYLFTNMYTRLYIYNRDSTYYDIMRLYIGKDIIVSATAKNHFIEATATTIQFCFEFNRVLTSLCF